MKLKDMKFIKAIKEHAPELLERAFNIAGNSIPTLGMVTDLIGSIGKDKREAIINALDQDYKDIANARDHDLKIQNSEFGSWMSKNVGYILDLFFCGIWGALTIYIVFSFMNLISSEGVDMTSILAIWGGVTGLATTVLQFHRGSSQGSKTKDLLKR